MAPDYRFVLGRNARGESISIICANAPRKLRGSIRLTKHFFFTHIYSAKRACCCGGRPIFFCCGSRPSFSARLGWAEEKAKWKCRSEAADDARLKEREDPWAMGSVRNWNVVHYFGVGVQKRRDFPR